MELIIGVSCLLLGLGMGFVIARWQFLAHSKTLVNTHDQMKKDMQNLEHSLAQSQDERQCIEREKVTHQAHLEATVHERDRLLAQTTSQTDKLLQFERQLAQSESRAENLQARYDDHEKEISELQQRFQAQFENLAQRIFEEKATSFKHQSEASLKQLLDPLKERISDFQRKVDETYQSEARERFALKSEIARIVETNQVMRSETESLTRALRGDVKAQGNWGEIVLERILEAAGLREGEEYITQGKDLKLKDAQGKRQMPDVIINLPDNKQIIVDSKVSLTHYEQIVNDDDPEQARKKFLNSIDAHINGLSGKKYHFNDALVSPDFVLLFFPIEGAFSLALQTDPALFSRAWEKSIIIVSPTTLLATLRTVASIWKQERQNRNTHKIATESGRLYDKFVGFIKDLENIGASLKRTDALYSDAMNKLSGRGSIITKVESLKSLGAKAAKSIPAHLLDS